MKKLRAEIVKVCKELNLVYADTGAQWIDKVKGGMSTEQIFRVSGLEDWVLVRLVYES